VGGTGGAGGPAGRGGNGGAIDNDGSMTLTDSSIEYASAGYGGRGGFGGAGGAGGCTCFSVNTSQGGGVGGTGGAGGATGAAGAGGAIFNAAAGRLRLLRVTIDSVFAGGGGVAGTGGPGGAGADALYANQTGARGGDGGPGTAATAMGGGGGAIASFGALSIADVSITFAQAGDGGGGGAGGDGGPGGGAWVNPGYGGNGGAGGLGGHGATGGAGGAIFTAGAGATIDATTISESDAGSSGGGAGGRGGHYGVGCDTFGCTDIPARLHDGAAGPGGDGGNGGSGGSGGAVYVAGGDATLTNVTLAGNFAGTGGGGGSGLPGGNGGNGGTGGNDGAIALATGAVSPPTVDLESTTIVGNSAGAAGDGGPAAFGYLDGAAGSAGTIGGFSLPTRATAAITEEDTLVAGNSPVNCNGATDDGGNLSYGSGVSDRSCPGLDADPKLGALADNGGPVATMALGAGSAAIDAVPASGAGCRPGDARGVPRPQGAGCDIGAYERAEPPECHDVSVTTPYGRAATVTLNCSDATGTALSYAIDTQPAHGTLGTLGQSAATIVYTPASGFSGADHFTYHASSLGGDSASQTVSLTVTPRPDPPALTGVTPPSPSSDDKPSVTGTAPTGSTVSLYTTSDCSGTAAATGTAAALATQGIPVPVAHDATTTFHATATDSANVVSLCSSTSVSYTHDDTPPTIRIDDGPSGPTANRRPTFTFSAGEPGVTFACSIAGGTPSYGSCSGPTSDQPSADLADGTYTFRVRATDAAENVQEATRSFTVDTRSPTVNIESGPSGASTAQRPAFTFAADETPVLLRCSLSQGEPRYTACDSGQFQVQAPLTAGVWTFSVTATDAAGNASAAARRQFTVATAAARGTLAASLRAADAPEGAVVNGADLLRRNGYAPTFRAPAAGILQVTWYAADGTVVASGSATAKKRGTIHITIALLPAGRALLSNRKPLTLTTVAVFTSRGGHPVDIVKRLSVHP
jgi:hypothetical protein